MNLLSYLVCTVCALFSLYCDKFQILESKSSFYILGFISGSLIFYLLSLKVKTREDNDGQGTN